MHIIHLVFIFRSSENDELSGRKHALIFSCKEAYCLLLLLWEERQKVTTGISSLTTGPLKRAHKNAAWNFAYAVVSIFYSTPYHLVAHEFRWKAFKTFTIMCQR